MISLSFSIAFLSQNYLNTMFKDPTTNCSMISSLIKQNNEKQKTTTTTSRCKIVKIILNPNIKDLRKC